MDNVEAQELGISDEERLKRKRILDRRSGADLKKRWEQGDREELANREQDIAPPVITEPRCHVCFLPGTLVRSDRGFISIENIQKGDRVLSGDHQYHSVNRVFCSEYKGKIQGIQTHGNPLLVWATQDHPIGVLVGDHKITRPCEPWHCANDGHRLGWSEARLLDETTYVALNHSKEVVDLQTVVIPEMFRGQKAGRSNGRQQGCRRGKNQEKAYTREGKVEFDLTPDFLWMIGLYIAEGSSDKRRSINFALHKDETDYQNRLIDIFTSLGYRPKLVLRDEKPNSAWVYVHNTSLAEWFPRWLGDGSANKHIPEELMQLPGNRLQYLITGIDDGDGAVAKDNLFQTSLILALQVAEYGMRVSRPISMASTFRNNRKVAYRTTGAMRDRKSASNKQATWQIAGRQFSKIKTLLQKEYEGPVYNLEVEGDPTYTVQNLLVHNCMSPYREFIEECLIKGHSYERIAKRIPPDEDGKKIDRRSISNHLKEHLDLQRTAIREELEEEARALQQNVEQGSIGAKTDRGILKVLVAKGFDDVLKGVSTVEPKDLIQIIKLLNELNNNASSTRAEENEVAMRTFVRAIETVCPPEMIKLIVAEAERIKNMDDIEFEMAGVIIRDDRQALAELPVSIEANAESGDIRAI